MQMRELTLPAGSGEGLTMHDRLFEEKALYEYVGEYAALHHLEQTAKALPYAADMHKGQLRYGSEHVPYIYHPVLMACHLISMGLDEDALLTVCLLHDVCEDCHVGWEELPFSDEVKRSVCLLTKPEGFDVSDELQEETYYRRIGTDRLAALVKVVDRCNNISTMPAVFTGKGLYRYTMETQRWVMPLLDEIETAWPQYDKVVFLLRYQMLSVLTGVKRILSDWEKTGK